MKRRAGILTTDAEIEAIVAESVSNPMRGARAVRYDRKHDVVELLLEDGVNLAVPRRMIRSIEDASPRDLGDIKLEPGGCIVLFSKIDSGFYIPELLTDLFGDNKCFVEHGRRGGRAKSERKTKAVRENGKKGGRPRKRAA